MRLMAIALIFTAGFTALLQAESLVGMLSHPHSQQVTAPSKSDRILGRAFRLGLSEFKIQCAGTVIRELSDDTEGIRHQRFIIRLASGQTLLIVHNIDLAPRMSQLMLRDRVVVKGEYIWNEEGGLMHLTHKDPDGVGFHGFIRHKGRIYQ
jgi:hypothetical protein